MKALAAPFHRQSRWWLLGYCVRHPILALAAARQTSKPIELSDTQKGLFLAALIHGFVAALIS